MKVFIVLLSFLVGTAVSLPYQLHSNHFTRRLLNEVKPGKSQPPKAMKLKHKMEMFGDVRNDDYYWLRDDNTSDPNVLAYLQEESDYTALIMSGTNYLQDQIYAEMVGKIKGDETSTPVRRGPFYYYKRFVEGKQHVQFCRRLAPNGGDKPSYTDVMPTGLGSSPEHVMLDVNERAQGHPSYTFGLFKVSPNHKIAAYTEDTKGDRVYTANVIDLKTGKPVEKYLIGLSYNVVWAGNEALLYVTMDATYRPEKVWLHKLGEEQSNDVCLYHEKDNKFSLDIEASESKKYVFVGSESTNTRFIFSFDIANPKRGLIPLTSRTDGTKTWAHHRGTHFFIKKTSNELFNSELLACSVANVSAIVTILPHRESVTITTVQLFSDHLVFFERENGFTKLVVFDLPPLGQPIVLQNFKMSAFKEPAYAVYAYPSGSDFSSGILRFYYSSLRTPQTVFDADMNTGMVMIKSSKTVLGGFNSSDYSTERKWATSPDGCQIPMSIVYRKDLVKLDGSDPLLLYAYGAYGVSVDPIFMAKILPLLDRGFVYVIAHVRGGGEMGIKWSENGKLLKKKNTFLDFIACADYLIKMKYCGKEKLVIDGQAAGGLLIGAVLNKRPDLCRVAIVQAPIVDVVTTLLDSTVPGIASEWEEWGDPHMEKFYYYIRSYSPLDNVSAKAYPSILVTTRQNFPRLYSNSAKFVAKLRDMKIDENMLLLKTSTSAANSGRDEVLNEEAFIYTFILKALNMVD